MSLTSLPSPPSLLFPQLLCTFCRGHTSYLCGLIASAPEKACPPLLSFADVLCSHVHTWLTRPQRATPTENLPDLQRRWAPAGLRMEAMGPRSSRFSSRKGAGPSGNPGLLLLWKFRGSGVEVLKACREIRSGACVRCCEPRGSSAFASRRPPLPWKSGSSTGDL